MNQPLLTHTHARTHTSHTRSPYLPKPNNPMESVQLPSVLQPKALSQQMLFCYHRQLSLLAASDKTLLSDPDVKEFNLSDAPPERTGWWRDEWASKIPSGLRDVICLFDFFFFPFCSWCCFWSGVSAVRSSVSKEALVRAERWAILRRG